MLHFKNFKFWNGIFCCQNIQGACARIHCHQVLNESVHVIIRYQPTLIQQLNITKLYQDWQVLHSNISALNTELGQTNHV